MLALQTYSIKAKDESISRTTARLSDKSNSCRCLDAAHGKSPAAIVAVKRRYRIRDGTQKTSIGAAGSGRRRRPTAGLSADIRQNTRRRVAVARSRRCKAIAQRNAAEGAEQWLLRLTLRRSSALLSRAGRSLGRRRPANIRLSPGVPLRLRPNPRQTYFVILSEAKNLFPCEPKAACGLCLARRRKTNEVQSRIYLGKGYRFFVGR